MGYMVMPLIGSGLSGEGIKKAVTGRRYASNGPNGNIHFFPPRRADYLVSV
jgi:hypothetical protein